MGPKKVEKHIYLKTMQNIHKKAASFNITDAINSAMC